MLQRQNPLLLRTLKRKGRIQFVFRPLLNGQERLGQDDDYVPAVFEPFIDLRSEAIDPAQSTLVQPDSNTCHDKRSA